jgi:hypothetical protein
MFQEPEQKQLPFVASNFTLPSEEKLNQIKNMINKQEPKNEEPDFLIQATRSKLNLLKLKGEL